jgi:hypothetical protein
MINAGTLGTGLVGYITHGMPGLSWTFEGAKGHPVDLVLKGVELAQCSGKLKV